jgi:uncharacterized ParB-like nuclease family protein
MSDWVAFNSDGFPYSFGGCQFYPTLAKFAKECPDAVRIERVEGEERTRLLKIHAGYDPDQPWPS